MNLPLLISSIVALLTAALFAGIEMAFIAAGKLPVGLENGTRTYPGNLLAPLFNHPSRFVGTTWLMQVFALVVYGIGMTIILRTWLVQGLPSALQNEAAMLILQILITALVAGWLTGFLPRYVFQSNPDRLLAVFAVPAWLSYLLLYPLVSILHGTYVFLLTRIFHYPIENKMALSLAVLRREALSDEEEAPVEEAEANAEMFHNALSFKTIRVRECMIPRTEIAAIEINGSVEDLRRTFVDSGHSKILVYRETIDDVIGYCHALEMFKKPKDIAGILNPMMVVAETMLASELLVKFISERKSLGLVVDEFGGTAGLISLEDVMEQIFGEIQDEYDTSEDWVEMRIDEHTYLLSARHEIDYLNDKYGWNLPEGNYDTLGGLVISVYEDIPSVHEKIDVPPFTFTVVSKQDARLDTVRLTIDKALRDDVPE